MSFTYFITAPAPQHLYALTIHGNTITLYRGQMSDVRYFCYSVNLNQYNYYKQTTFGHAYQSDHKKMHNSMNEFHITHTHVRHKDNITPINLKELLLHLAPCEIVNEPLINDIVHEFQKFCKSKKVSKVTSNNSSYKKMPKDIYPLTIPEHLSCMNYDDKGCIPTNPLTPIRMNPNAYCPALALPAPENHLLKQAAGASALLGLGMLLFGLFRKCTKTRPVKKENATSVVVSQLKLTK